ncbi:hypothetical protein HYT23_06715 [Candidatus Pacearchaeota archaeon]|nr:hypothetical protein [Candidatus Pacearchaeota archaeon]
MKIGIMGYGEIGSSLHKVYSDFPEFDARIKELNWQDDLSGIEILNVCISFPSKERFVSSVCDAIEKYNPNLTIIHSTVKPGTTLEVIAQTKSRVVHSPVQGVHPYLYEGIKEFTKYIGYEDDDSRKFAEEHFLKLGISFASYKGTKTTELAKLLDTTYYGVCIAWHGEMKKICDAEGVDFGIIGDWNRNYNENYPKQGKTNVVRPVLTPPDGKIRGHCVIPNTRILSEDYDSPALDLVLKYE